MKSIGEPTEQGRIGTTVAGGGGDADAVVLPLALTAGATARATPVVDTPAVERAAVNAAAPLPEAMLVMPLLIVFAAVDEVAVTVNATLMPLCMRWRPLPEAAVTLVMLIEPAEMFC